MLIGERVRNGLVVLSPRPGINSLDPCQRQFPLNDREPWSSLTRPLRRSTRCSSTAYHEAEATFQR